MSLNCTIVRAVNNTGLPELIYARTPIQTGWSNVNFFLFPPKTDNDPIDLILRLLISTGDTANPNYSGTGTNFDVYEPGVGLGIPQDQIDIPSFTKIQAQYDYDVNQKMFFLFSSSEPAKDFIEQELCRPLGLYLHTGNDGIIRCVQPRHPQKFYIGAPNGSLGIHRNVNVTPKDFTATIPIGVYTGDELALQVTFAIWAAIPTYSSQALCSYDISTHTFSLSFPESVNLFDVPGNGYSTLGWQTLPINGFTAGNAPFVRGVFSGSTLTQDDMWGLQVLDNADDRIASVTFVFDFDPDAETFRSGKRYVDIDAINLADSLCPADYTISSRGLISAGNNAAPWVGTLQKPTTGCIPVKSIPNPASGVDADTWSKLYALSLLDRYKQPPLKFRARLKWKWNTLELGDVVRINYTIPGVLTDYELNAAILANRLFEIVELHPNFDGSVDATFLGHRYVSY